MLKKEWYNPSPMKKLLGLFFLATSLSAWSKAPQDIYIKSRFDYDSSGTFLKNIRAFLVHNNFGDPYKQTIKKDLVLDLAQALESMPSDTKQWIRELQSVLNLKLFESRYSIIIQGLSYSVDNFNPELGASVPVSNRAEYVTTNFVRGLTLAAEKIVISAELKKTTSGEPIRFDLEMVKPKFNISQDLEVDLPMLWETAVTPNNVVLSLQKINLNNVLAKIVNHPEMIDFQAESLNLPQVSVRIGHKEIKFNNEKIRQFFEKNEDATKLALLDLIKSKMEDRFINILESPRDLLISRTYQINESIHAVFDLERINANRAGIIQVDMDGHFCPKNKDAVFEKFCPKTPIPAKLRREIPQEQTERSLREMNRFLIENKGNIALSVSEHYINQIVQSTIEAGRWEKDLAGKNFRLGPETVFVLSDVRGEEFSVYIDIIHELSSIQRIMVGKKEIRFPVKMMAGLKIVEQNGIPALQITVKKVVTDEKLILNGLPQYGLPSTVNSGRFKKKMIKEIMSAVKHFEGNMLVNLQLEEFKGTYLERVQFFSDGAGRATAILNFAQENLYEKAFYANPFPQL